MRIILYGPDTYSSQKKLAAWIKMFQEKKDPQGLNLVTLGAESLTSDIFRRLVLSAGLFTAKRLIVIENFFKKNKDEYLAREILNFLKTSAKDERQANSIIFWEEDLTEKNLSKTQQTILGLLKKQKYSQEFPWLTKAKLSLWIDKLLAKNHQKIAPLAKEYLIQEIGPDLWQLSNEFNKLSVLPEKNISLEYLKQFILPRPEEEIWPLVDALGNKNKKLALKLLSDQLEVEGEVGAIFGMLVRQYRILLMVREVLAQEKFINHFQLAKKLQLHPFVCQKAIKQAKNYTLSELKNIYQKLFNLDLKIKTTSINPEVLLDLLIVKSP